MAGIIAWVSDGTLNNIINYGQITADSSNVLKSSIMGYVGYDGESHNNVYSQDNINILSGKTNSKTEEINN